jgi:STE24 endopeptidase
VALAALAVAAVVVASLLWPTQVPGSLDVPELDPNAYFERSHVDEARAYERFTYINAVLSIVVLLGVLALYARRGERFARESAAGRIGTGMLLGMVGFAFVWIAQLPFGLAQVWWDRRHDVSEVGYLEWIVNSWLSLGGVFVFVCIAIVVVMALARPFRRTWWIPGAAVFVGLGLLFSFVAPYLVPDQHALRDDALARQAKELAREQGVADIPVRVEDVDQFTDEPNAFAAGLGPTRRVILWNTLLGPPFSDREVRVVIAHELAHHSRDHIWKSFGWFALLAVPMALLVAVATRSRGGMYEARAVPIALFVAVALQIAVSPAQNVTSRRLEAEADWVALQTARYPRAQRDVFRDLTETSLADPDPPVWSYVLFDTHPTAMQRIGMAEAWRVRDARP